MVKVCGEEMDAAGLTVTELLEKLKYQKVYVAVEINEEIIPKAAYDETILQDGDTCEVVSFVGGG